MPKYPKIDTRKGYEKSPDYGGKFRKGYRFEIIAASISALFALVAFFTTLRVEAQTTKNVNDQVSDMSVTPVVVLVERVIDGDTVELFKPINGVTRVRLDGIDTPERNSAHCNREKLMGYEATGYARAILEGKEVKLHTNGNKGKWGRLIARIEIDGQDYSQMMINKGYAVRYTSEWAALPPEKRWCKGRDLKMFNR